MESPCESFWLGVPVVGFTEVCERELPRLHRSGFSRRFTHEAKRDIHGCPPPVRVPRYVPREHADE